MITIVVLIGLSESGLKLDIRTLWKKTKKKRRRWVIVALIGVWVVDLQNRWKARKRY